MGKKYSTQEVAVIVAVLISLTFFFVDNVNAQVAATGSFRLIGTIKSRNFGGAVFQDTNGKQSFFQLYEKLPDGSQIVKVRDDSISLKGDDGTIYDMYISRVTKTIASVNPPAVSPSVNLDPAQGSGIQEKYTERQKQRRLRRERRNQEDKE